MTQAIPAGYNTLTARLIFKDSKKAIDYYTNALDAEIIDMKPGENIKGISYASLKIGNSMIMMSDERSGSDSPKSAATTGNSPISLYVYVTNVDALFDRAVAAGGSVVMPVAETFWGDRCGTLTDPFGYTWMIATRTRDLTDEQISIGASEFYKQRSM